MKAQSEGSWKIYRRTFVISNWVACKNETLFRGCFLKLCLDTPPKFKASLEIETWGYKQRILKIQGSGFHDVHWLVCFNFLHGPEPSQEIESFALTAKQVKFQQIPSNYNLWGGRKPASEQSLGLTVHRSPCGNTRIHTHTHLLRTIFANSDV